MTAPQTQLTKSQFAAGLQCHKLLWWRVHEPLAKELQPDIVLEDRFDQARQVGELARSLFPGGELIEQGGDRSTRIAGTRAIIGRHPGPVFEAAFGTDKVFVAVDALVPLEEGYLLVEVKSASGLKDEHIPDAAVQTWAALASGIDVRRVEIVHLNKEFRHPDTGPLFSRTDVTAPVMAFLSSIPELLEGQLEAVAGPSPAREIGEHCDTPRECPFKGRCWPDDRDHIANLHNCGTKKAAAWMRSGITRISQLTTPPKRGSPAERQMRALTSGRMIVEPGLRAALGQFDVEPLGFLDFETVNRAIPVWEGMGPWRQAAAQFSYHETGSGGALRHEEFLAEGALDARPEVARRLIEVTRSAKRVVMYSAFEKTQINALAVAVPEQSTELLELRDKLIDLLPVVKDNVYHPDFNGSFSIKAVLGPMVPGLDYSDLIIVDGLVASVQIARLLFVSGRIRPEERPRVREDLLRYCERDTFATVRLLARLRELADS
ncbi:MAG: DUF2779 domain-containing protein [Gemmatimonadota bacterium]